jgi:hypothetical protein
VWDESAKLTSLWRAPPPDSSSHHHVLFSSANCWSPREHSRGRKYVEAELAIITGPVSSGSARNNERGWPERIHLGAVRSLREVVSWTYHDVAEDICYISVQEVDEIRHMDVFLQTAVWTRPFSWTRPRSSLPSSG